MGLWDVEGGDRGSFGSGLEGRRVAGGEVGLFEHYVCRARCAEVVLAVCRPSARMLVLRACVAEVMYGIVCLRANKDTKPREHLPLRKIARCRAY